VVLAETTIVAYQIAITRPTDIVVTDGHCAGSMTGLELTRRLRTHTRTSTVPIIVITSETRRQVLNCPLKLGQTCSLRDRYREMRYANTWDGYSWRADVC
jgi:CheY-like chemotaxis protein